MSILGQALGAMGAGGGGLVGRAVVELVGDSSKLRADMAKAKAEVTTGADQMGGRMARFQAMSKVAFAAVGVAALAAAAASVKAWIQFDDKMTQSIAIMGDVSDRMRSDMEATAREVAKTTTFSADQAAEAYYFLASAGLDANASMAALPVTAKFAQAGMFDLAKATDILTDAQSALGLTIRDDAVANMENMVRVSDVLVRANTLANASVEQFGIALTSKAGAALRTTNKDLEEGVAVLAVYADQGTKAQLAGERLNIFLRDLPRAVSKNSQAWQEFGISVQDSEGNLLNMADIVENMTAVLGPMSDAQRAAAFDALGLTRGAGDATRQLLGTAEMIRFYELELRAAAGTTDEVANKQLQSLSAQLSLAGSAVADLGLSLGSALAPAIRESAEALQDVATVLGNVIDLATIMVEKAREAKEHPIGKAIAEGVDDALDNLPMLGTVRKLWDEIGEATGDATTHADEMSAAYKKLGRDIFDAAKPISDAQEAARYLGESLYDGSISAEDARAKIEEWNAAVDKMGGGAKISADAVMGAARAAGQQEDALNGVTTAAKQAADAQEDATKAAIDLRNAQLSAAGGLLGIQGAALSAKSAQAQLAESEAEVAKLLKNGKKGTDEYKEAMRDLRGAQLSTVQSQVSLAQAVSDFAGKVESGEMSQREAVGLVREYGKMAGLSKEDVNGLVDRVKDLIGKYRELPTSKHTRVTADTSDAQRKFEILNEQLRAIPRLVTTTIRANVVGGGNMPAMASGGIVTRPTVALVGEGTRRTFAGRGAEAVIPLSQDVLGTLGQEIVSALGKNVSTRSEGGSSGRPLTVYIEVDGKTLSKSVTLHQDETRITLGGRKAG